MITHTEEVPSIRCRGADMEKKVKSERMGEGYSELRSMTVGNTGCGTPQVERTT